MKLFIGVPHRLHTFQNAWGNQFLTLTFDWFIYSSVTPQIFNKFLLRRDPFMFWSGKKKFSLLLIERPSVVTRKKITNSKSSIRESPGKEVKADVQEQQVIFLKPAGQVSIQVSHCVLLTKLEYYVGSTELELFHTAADTHKYQQNCRPMNSVLRRNSRTHRWRSSTLISCLHICAILATKQLVATPQETLAAQSHDTQRNNKNNF